MFYAIFVKFSTDFVDWNVEKSQQGTNLLSSSLFRRDLGRKISRWSAGVLFLLFSPDRRPHLTLFSTDFTRFTVNPAVTGSSPCFSQILFRGPLFQFFVDTVRLFFRFFCLPRVLPSSLFLIFCSKLKCQKAQRVSPFKYFGTIRLFKILIFRKVKKINIFKEKISKFSCLQRVPLHFI